MNNDLNRAVADYRNARQRLGNAVVVALAEGQSMQAIARATKLDRKEVEAMARAEAKVRRGRR